MCFKADRNARVAPLHPRYVAAIVREATIRLKRCPNLNQASTALSRQITICGDIHGKLDDLLIVLHKNGLPSAENPYIFNGDFVDRGKRSIEVLVILLSVFLLFPGAVYLNRGNHEDHIINLRYGFVREMRSKYKQHADRLLVLIERLYRWLPLGTLIDNKVFVVHGGISDVTDLTVIRNAERQKYVSLLRTPISDSSVHSEPARDDKQENAAEGEGGTPGVDKEEWKQVFDILWSDPSTNEGCEPNTLRGAGTYFGPDTTTQFLEKHGLSLLVRSHECKLDGYELTHGDKVITIFSASNYYEVGSNKGAYLKLLGPELTPHFVQYTSAGGPVSMAKGKKGHLIGGVQVGPEEGPPRQMTFRQRVGLVERSAIRELKGRILNKQDSLMEEFKKTDPTGSGYITISSWCTALEKKTGLCAIPWRMLRDRLVSIDHVSGHVEYNTTFKEESLQRRAKSGTTLVETLYRNKSSLEAIFKIIDTDNSGLISMEEFKEAWILLSKHLDAERNSNPDRPYSELAPSPSLHQMLDIARTMDMNKDGLIDLNEFMEAFRLVDPGGDEDSDDDSERED